MYWVAHRVNYQGRSKTTYTRFDSMADIEKATFLNSEYCREIKVVNGKAFIGGWKKKWEYEAWYVIEGDETSFEDDICSNDNFDNLFEEELKIFFNGKMSIILILTTIHGEEKIIVDKSIEYLNLSGKDLTAISDNLITHPEILLC